MQTVETLNEGLKRAYTLTIAAKDIAALVDGEVAKLAPQIRMPGFRPGKVPANLIKKMHGESLQAEALNTAVQQGIQKLVVDQKLRPAMSPSVNLDEGYAHGKDAEVKVDMEVLPDVPDPKIDGLKLERLVVEADEAAVDEAVKRIASGQKSWDEAPAKHKARDGDLVMVDFLGKVDGEAFDGGKGDNVAIEIGSGRLIPGFEEQLVGLAANEEKVISVSFPESYSVDYLKGKAATFDILVNEVKTPKDVVVDDEFAKSLGLEGLDQLKSLMKGQIEQENAGLTRTHMKRRLLDQLATSHDFEVPPSMVEAEFNQIWAQLEHEAGQEEDPEAAKKEMDGDRDEYRNIAVRRVRLGLLLSEIGQKNGVEITNQEMNQLIGQAAAQYDPKDRERFYEYVQNDPMAAAQLRAPLYEDKVVDFLFAKAEVTDRAVSVEELTAAIEAEDDGHVHGPGCGHDHHDEKPKAKKAAAKKDDAPAEKPAKKAAAPKAEKADAEAKPAKAAKPAAKKAK